MSRKCIADGVPLFCVHIDVSNKMVVLTYIISHR